VSADSEEGCCKICHAHMDVAFGDEPTDICHSCAYDELDRLKASVKELAADNELLRRLLEQMRASRDEAVWLLESGGEPT
jgi:hypothetical protein